MCFKPLDDCRVSYATTCSLYRPIEKGLPRFAHDSPEVHSIKAATGFSGEGGASSTYLTLLGLQRSRLTLTEGLKRFRGDKKGIGCAVFQLSPDRSMKPQRDVWLIALPNGGNLLPSDAISQAVKLNVSRSCFLLSPSYSPRLLRNNSLGLSRSHPDRAFV